MLARESVARATLVRVYALPLRGGLTRLGARRSRRDFLMIAGSSLAALVAPGVVRAAARLGGTGTARYYTRPDLTPPLIEVATSTRLLLRA